MSLNHDLKDILKKYANHPDFLGIDLVDPNQKGAIDDAPLHIAVRRGSEEDVLELLNHGADINMKGDLGNTPLHFAAMVGRAKIVKLLLKKGANPKLLNEFSETPLKVSQLGDKKEVEEILKEV